MDTENPVPLKVAGVGWPAVGQRPASRKGTENLLPPKVTGEGRPPAGQRLAPGKWRKSLHRFKFSVVFRGVP